jgi:5,10-methylene-tetrahydrofolate dehydrogenase/methenyl tetrahydrofolate cyclohydrolase
MANIIDGTAIAAQIRTELKATIDELKEEFGVVPGLAVVLVGGRRDSATYVRMKKKACAEIGMASFGFDYPAEVSQEELIAKIDELNIGNRSLLFESAMSSPVIFNRPHCERYFSSAPSSTTYQ